MKIQLTTILRAHSLWIPKVCLMRWTMIYLRMTESLLWMCQPLKNSCAEQCVDLDGVHTIEMQLTPRRISRERIGTVVILLRTGMHMLKGEKTELADRANLRQTGTVPRHKVSAVRAVTERTFFVHMPSD